MLNYTVHVHILRERQDEWKQYMMQHIRDVLNTGHFIDIAFKKYEPGEALDPEGKPADPRYAQYVIDYLCPSKVELRRYETNGASRLQADHDARFKGQYKAFRIESREYADVLQEYFLKDARAKSGPAAA
jgi:Domain of unknown function (DUF4286)